MENQFLEEKEVEVTFKEIVTVLIHNWKTIFLVTAVCFLLSAAYAFFWPPTYEAVATVKVPESNQKTNNAIRQLAMMPTGGDPIQTYVEIAESQSVAESVQQALQLGSNPNFPWLQGLTKQKLMEKLLKNVKVLNSTSSNIKMSNILTIKAYSGTPQSAADLANTWAKGFIQVNLSLNRKAAQSRYQFIHEQLGEAKTRLLEDEKVLKNYLAPTHEAQADVMNFEWLLGQDLDAHIVANVDDSGIVVLDNATAPEKRFRPKRLTALLIGLLLGLFLGTQGCYFIDRLQDRVKGEEDMERATGRRPLALIPNFRQLPAMKGKFHEKTRFSSKYLIDNPDFEHSGYRESFKTLRTNLIFVQVDKKLQTLGVFSPNPAEGKTLANANLALSLSHTGKKVLLVDADLRKPALSILFETAVSRNSGLPLLLAGKGDLEEMVHPSPFENLWLLPNKIIPPNPAELMGSEAMKRVVGEMKQQYDYIVFDGAPVLPVTDSALLSRSLDGVLLLARFNQTRRAEVRRAVHHLQAVNATLLGTFLNGVDVRKGLFGYGYGYGYGYGHDQEKDKKGAPKESLHKI